MIMQRLIFEQSLETKIIPPHFIFSSLRLAFLCYFHSFFQTHSILSLMVYFIALFFVLLLIFLSKILANLALLVFEVGFSALASFDLFITYKFKYFYGFFGFWRSFFCALFAVFFIFYKTLSHQQWATFLKNIKELMKYQNLNDSLKSYVKFIYKFKG